MKDFLDIATALGLESGGTTNIGTNPTLVVTHNSGGRGYQRSLVAALQGSPSVHVTIYQSSWDDEVTIPDLTGGPVTVGPRCFHLTAGKSGRCFFQVGSLGDLTQVTDHFISKGEYSTRVAAETFMHILWPYMS